MNTNYYYPTMTLSKLLETMPNFSKTLIQYFHDIEWYKEIKAKQGTEFAEKKLEAFLEDREYLYFTNQIRPIIKAIIRLAQLRNEDGDRFVKCLDLTNYDKVIDFLHLPRVNNNVVIMATPPKQRCGNSDLITGSRIFGENGDLGLLSIIVCLQRESFRSLSLVFPSKTIPGCFAVLHIDKEGNTHDENFRPSITPRQLMERSLGISGRTSTYINGSDGPLSFPGAGSYIKNNIGLLAPYIEGLAEIEERHQEDEE